MENVNPSYAQNWESIRMFFWNVENIERCAIFQGKVLVFIQTEYFENIGISYIPATSITFKTKYPFL